MASAIVVFGNTSSHASAFPGKIYCSHITRLLLTMKFPAFPAHRLIALELNVPHTIPVDSSGSIVTCTLIDANHCPGAVVLHARCNPVSISP
jgi:hypothetical protein